ncbi:MAG: aspartate-semialdehyde dehydrogenase [archaeon]
MKQYKVGILGATGTVGQRFIQLLEGHPWFRVTEVAGSERSSGLTYGEATAERWKLPGGVPEYAADLIVRDAKTNLDCDIVFSAMDNTIAGPIEEEFAKAGYAVCSNARNHRMEPDVPLVIPEVNPGHLGIIEHQRKERGWDGLIATNPNCSTIGLVMALAPIQPYGLKKVFVTTMQALSGAGYPGVPSLDSLDNVVPFIGGEEEKIESESVKILGTMAEGKFGNAKIAISAQCNRVGVNDGHLETLNIEVEKKAGLDEIRQALSGFNPLRELKLPSAPNPPIIVRDEENRPQPKLDRDMGRGMAVSVGRIRKCNILDYRMAILSHNTIRGAAGASILNAELICSKGLLK